MDETLNPVDKDMMWATTMIPIVAISPACPTMVGNLKYIITPKIVKIEGVKTPPKVPNLADLAIG